MRIPVRYIVLAVLSVILVGGLVLGAAGFFSYGFKTNYGAEVKIAGLKGGASIGWRNDRIPIIEASTEEDALTALGYSHALRHILAMSVWRQAALGEMGQWFEGDSIAALDRFSKTLNLAKAAQNAYYNLPEMEKQRLRAYAKGVNTVLENPKVHQNEELLLSELQPEVWKPWHSLAIEHLLAWVGADPYHKTAADTLQPQFDAFRKADRKFKSFLRLHGFENGMAWAYQLNGQTHLFQRHVYGSTAWPLIQEVVMRWNGNLMTLATVPGTLLFPSGRSDRLSWHFLLTSRFTAERQAAGVDSLVKPQYEVFRNLKGDETLVETRRAGTSFYLPETIKQKNKITQRDTTFKFTWLMRWDGFRESSDQGNYFKLLQGDTTGVRFSLFKGNGLLVDRNGNIRVRGNPMIREAITGGVLISESEWARYTAAQLRDHIAKGEIPDQFLTQNADHYSAWVTPLSKGLRGGIAKRRDLTYAAKDAVSYLRNWKSDFGKENIAASIFDAWLAEYTRGYGAIPVADSSFFAAADSAGQVQTSLKLKNTLLQTIKNFRSNTSLGEDYSRWRWEFAQAGEVYYPLWNTSYLPHNRTNLAETRFAPVNVAGGGHPTTLHWRATRILTDLPASSVWEGWFSTGRWSEWNVYRANLVHEGVLARYSIPDRQQKIVLATDDAEVVFATTHLIP